MMAHHFLSWLMMHGFWPFVWSAYGVFLLIILINIIVARFQHNALIKQLHKQAITSAQTEKITTATVIIGSS